MAKGSRSARVQAWGPYVRCIADLMTLRDWTFYLEDNPAEEGARAQIWCLPGKRTGQIAFADEFLDDTNESQQRHTVVHELFHAHWSLAMRMAERRFGRHWEDFRDVLEHAIDASADAMSPLLPLPSHVKPPKPNKKG